MATSQCKLPTTPPSARRTRRRAALLACAAVVPVLVACNARPVCRTVTTRALETGRQVRPKTTWRTIVADARPLGELYRPLSPRLGFVQIRNARDWAALVRLVPQLGPCPDFQRGIVVALLSVAGLPLDGQWPIALESIRLRDGAGLVTARFHGGTYLPDGMTFVELAFVEDLDAVLILDVNGVRFYPQ